MDNGNEDFVMGYKCLILIHSPNFSDDVSGFWRGFKGMEDATFAACQSAR